MATCQLGPVVTPCAWGRGEGLSKAKRVAAAGCSDSRFKAGWPQATFSGRISTSPSPKSRLRGRDFGGERSRVWWRKSLSRCDFEAEAVAGSDLAQAESPSSVESGADPARHAVDIVYEFYDGINNRDYERVAGLFADECAYEDFNFSRPAQGKEEVLNFFRKIVPALGTEFMFVIDDVTRGDPDAVGVLWHLDWRGKKIPNGRGCSFYRCEIDASGVRQIKYARDIVEPATKPGFIAMGALRLIAALLKRFPQLGNGF